MKLAKLHRTSFLQNTSGGYFCNKSDASNDDIDYFKYNISSFLVTVDSYLQADIYKFIKIQ